MRLATARQFDGDEGTTEAQRRYSSHTSSPLLWYAMTVALIEAPWTAATKPYQWQRRIGRVGGTVTSHSSRPWLALRRRLLFSVAVLTVVERARRDDLLDGGGAR
ncbi:hypothetical protein AAHE18_17G122800 [Arachis hypogaea]|nr:uncharacterized protein DS421_17g583660 [Arachis hypogaea]